MSKVKEIDKIFKNIPFDFLNYIVWSSDFGSSSGKILKEDNFTCGNLKSNNLKLKINNLFEGWIEEEKVKKDTIDKVYDICKDRKTILILDQDISVNLNSENIDIKQFKTFKDYIHQMYTILIIEDDEGYSYFEIFNF